jgi:methanogenic corrinoid protein MtbC1
MFRWCSYCQHLMGESAPFDDYRVTHGICESCEGQMECNDPAFPVKGLGLFQRLFAAARDGDTAASVELAEEALAQGWTPSDVAMGLLQPGLYQIGQLWSEGKVTVADEHQFTAWCDRSLGLLESRGKAVPGPTRVLICMVEGNAHSLGPRIAALYIRDLGISARALVGDLPDDEILDLCRRESPDILGLSASMSPGISRARTIAARVQELPHPPRVVLGGLAARLPGAEGLQVAQTAADIESFLQHG